MKINAYKLHITSLAALTVTSLLFLSGCVTSHPSLVLDPVGPSPGLSSGRNPEGSLIVFSSFDPHGAPGGMDRQAHTSYEILTVDGKLLQKVHNDPGNLVGGPTVVHLATGSYHVLARANGYGLVTVPVVIRGGKETIIHLEGGGAWPNREEMIRANAVRLPDGRVAGWRSIQENTINQ